MFLTYRLKKAPWECFFKRVYHHIRVRKQMLLEENQNELSIAVEGGCIPSSLSLSLNNLKTREFQSLRHNKAAVTQIPHWKPELTSLCCITTKSKACSRDYFCFCERMVEKCAVGSCVCDTQTVPGRLKNDSLCPLKCAISLHRWVEHPCLRKRF